VALALGLVAIGLAGCGGSRATADYRYDFVYGESAMLRGRQAVAPKKAPAVVHRAVMAGNRLQSKPYRYGGGHRRVEDSGYDCSGTVSYVLINAGLLDSPMTSEGFKRYGERGPGKWISVYARDGHTFMTIGGLRLDTGWGSNRSGPRWLTSNRPARGYTVRHPRGF
jgi:hypothetical protein